jgi:hypothetical protein
MTTGKMIAFLFQRRFQARATSLTACIALSLSACSIGVKRPINAYPGPDLPVEQISVLKVTLGAKIESIDGQSGSPCTGREMHLLPGTHRIAIRELTASSHAWGMAVRRR